MVRRVAISNVIIPCHINLQWISSLLLGQINKLGYTRIHNYYYQQQLQHSYIDLGME